MSDTYEYLPFSGPKQEALLAHLIADAKFFAQARAHIRYEWWADPDCQLIWKFMCEFYDRFGRASSRTDETGKITYEELKEYIHDRNNVDQRAFERLAYKIQKIMVRMPDFGIDVLQTELTAWIQVRIYAEGMKESEAAFNKAASTQNPSDLRKSMDVLRALIKKADETSFNNGQVEDFSDVFSDIAVQQNESKDAISFGLPLLDKALLPEGDGSGGLLRGDMTVLLGATNSGKTTVMVTVTAVNIWKGNDCLFIPHEGRKHDLKMKIWQSMLGATRPELLQLYLNKGKMSDEDKAHLDLVTQKINKHLVLLPMMKAGLTVEEVMATVSRLQEERKAKTGKGFDLIVDDYAAKLTTAQARGGQFQYRQIQEVVYNYFTQMAAEHHCHVLTAIQTNREGSKINKKISTESNKPRFLYMEDVAESWGTMTTATNVISLNRDLNAQANGYMTFLICKSRSSEVNQAIVSETRFAQCRSHWPRKKDDATSPLITDQASTMYRMSAPMTHRVRDMLAEFNGQDIPPSSLLSLESMDEED